MSTWRSSRPIIRCAVAVLALFSIAASGVLVAQGPAFAAGPGSWTQAQVNTAIANGVAYLGTQQNTDGSFGTSAPIAETGMALLAYGVEASPGGVFNFSNLSTADQTRVKNAITYLLGQQDTSTDPNKGSWADFGSYFTYSTGIAVAGLNAFNGVNSAIPNAISLGRAFLDGVDFQAPPNTTCTTAQADPTSAFCGGWNYDTGYGRSDESNTGYAMFGLHETGGVPAGIQSLNTGWQNNVQSDTTSNPTYAITHNDGGASYQPGYVEAFDDFSSNANDSGTNLFSYAYDGVAVSDPRVTASMKFDQDVLNEYELEKGTSNADTMVFHSGTSEDGTCTIGNVGCDWNAGFGEGGFHYSMFSLTKGLGSFIPANLTSATNWYAQIVDLLLSQQNTDGSWPVDGRDDASTVFATGLSIASLGKVGTAPPPPPPSGCSSSSKPVVGHVFTIGNPQLEIVRVLITGSCLAGAEKVMFGSVPATSFSVGYLGNIVAIPPQQAAGKVDVTVTTSGGTSAPNPPADQYTYFLPRVLQVVPFHGSVTGGNTVIIHGLMFSGTPAPKVSFGTGNFSSSVVVVNDTTIHALVPPHSSGTVDVQVTAFTGTSLPTSADHYTYK